MAGLPAPASSHEMHRLKGPVAAPLSRVRVAGSGLWPGVAWAFGLCKRRDWGQLLQSYRAGEGGCGPLGSSLLPQLCNLRAPHVREQALLRPFCPQCAPPC